MRKLPAYVAILTLSAWAAGPAHAVAVEPSDLPAPGILGLVAAGVVVAIALARGRR